MPVPEAKVRALLAALLAHDGEPVSAGPAAADDLWGDDLPANPLGALQTKVSQLRARWIGRRAGWSSGPAGYRLRAEMDARASSPSCWPLPQDAPPRARLDLLAEALGLWRGPAFADFADEDFARPVASPVGRAAAGGRGAGAEARLALGEAQRGGSASSASWPNGIRCGSGCARVHCGRCTGRPAGRGAGRVRGAAAAARRASWALDPSPELAALHQSMLRQDPGLAPVRRARPGGPEPAGPAHRADRPRATPSARSVGCSRRTGWSRSPARAASARPGSRSPRPRPVPRLPRRGVAGRSRRPIAGRRGDVLRRAGRRERAPRA